MNDSNDTFVTTTTEGWLSRIGKSFMGILIGPVLIIGAIFLLGWNEGRDARTASALNEGKKTVIAVDATSVNAANNNKLVYLSGPAKTEEVLEDELFEVSQNALILRRDAQTYQWKENEKSSSKSNMGGSETTTTTYTYEKVWSDSLIDSSDFHKKDGHENPSQLRTPSEKFVAEEVELGAFSVNQELIAKLTGEKQLVISEEEFEETDDLKLYDGGIYQGDDPKNPQIGDVIVKFFYVEPTTISIVAKQTGSNLETYTAENGTPIGLVQSGVHSSDSLFQDALSENSIITWLLRLAGFVLSFIGFALIMKPLSVIADVVPFLGTLVGAGTGFISFILGLIVSTVTIAIAWFAYRPIAALILVGVVSVVVYLLSRRKKAKLTTSNQLP